MREADVDDVGTLARGGRSWVGASVAAVPHVLILALMAAGVASTEGVDRGYAALYGLLELYVVPVALLVAFVVRFVRRVRAWSVGIVRGTLGGAAVVVLATLIVGSGDTWR
jgi:hypothetical protein